MNMAPLREIICTKPIVSQRDRVLETLLGTFRISRKTSILSSDCSSSNVNFGGE